MVIVHQKKGPCSSVRVFLYALHYVPRCAMRSACMPCAPVRGCVCLGCSRFARSMQPPALRTAYLCTHAVGLLSPHSHPALGGRATPHPSRRRYPSGLHGAAAPGTLSVLTNAAALEMSEIAVSVSELGGAAAGWIRSRLQPDIGQEAGGDHVT